MVPDILIGGHGSCLIFFDGPPWPQDYLMEGYRRPSGAMHDPDSFSLSGIENEYKMT